MINKMEQKVRRNIGVEGMNIKIEQVQRNAKERLKRKELPKSAISAKNAKIAKAVLGINIKGLERRS